MSAGSSDASSLGVPASPADSLRDSSAALLAQAADELTSSQRQLRDSSAALLARAESWQSDWPADPEHGRLVTLDAARVVATFGVMWTHVAEMQGHLPAWAALGRFGTSFYVLAAVLLASRSTVTRPERSFGFTFRQRARRLLIPYVLWSGIYALFYLLLNLPGDMPLTELTKWWGPFAGTARHLWFLPFAFFAGTVASTVAKRLDRVPPRALIITATLGVTATYWLFYRVVFFALDRLWAIDLHLHRMDRWIEEVPLMVAAIFCSALYLRAQRSGGATSTSQPMLGALTSIRMSAPRLAWAMFGAFVALEVFYVEGYEFLDLVTHSEGRFVGNAAGCLLLGIFAALGARRWMGVVAPLGRLTYFAFLAHILLLDGLNRYLLDLPGYGTVLFSLLSTATLMAVCVWLASFIRRVPALRWLMP